MEESVADKYRKGEGEAAQRLPRCDPAGQHVPLQRPDSFRPEPYRRENYTGRDTSPQPLVHRYKRIPGREESGDVFFRILPLRRAQQGVRRILPSRQMTYQQPERDIAMAKEMVCGKEPVDLSHLHPSERGWGAVRCVQVMSERGRRGFRATLHGPCTRGRKCFASHTGTSGGFSLTS
jgi:hypothetical protein